MSSRPILKEEIISLLNNAIGLCEGLISCEYPRFEAYEEGTRYECPTYSLDIRFQDDIRHIAERIEQENIRSLNARYKGKDELINTYSDVTFTSKKTMDISQFIESLRYYEYQSCDHDGYEESDVKDFIYRLKSLAVRKLTHDNVYWGIPV